MLRHFPTFSIAARTACLVLGFAAGLAGSGLAQDVQQTYTIPLETFAYLDEASGSTYYKYGINISLGGGEAQTFEFDTGGEGFYAADVRDGWWGPDIVQTSDTFNKNFGSGISYSGTVAKATGLAFFSAPGSTTPILNLSSNTFAVGQAKTITQDGSTLWSADTSHATSPAPVQDHFYGDFGLSLKKGDHGIENAFAQLSYGNGITGGYVVSTGTYGSPNGTGYVRGGLTQADLTNPNTIWFTMSGSTGEMFTGSNFHTFSAELIDAKVTLTGTDGSKHGFAIGVNLDSGNPTPGLDYKTADQDILAPFTTDGRLSDNVVLQIDGVPLSSQDEQDILSFAANSLYGQNYVYEKERSDGGDTYLNIGTKIFQQYQITYDLQDGQIGLTPYTVPEPATFRLAFLGLIGLLVWLHRSRCCCVAS